MTELDEILEPRADRLRRQPPYPLVLSGTLVVRPEGRFVRTETAALIGPARGGEAASAGEYVSAIVPPDGQPVIVFPAAGAGGGDANVDATASAVTLPPGSAATVAVTEPVENLFDFDFGIPAGVNGAQGPAGAAGATGAQGPAGAQGAQGPKGDPGATPTVNAAVARQSANGLAVNISGGWLQIPVGALTSEPSDAFTVSAGAVVVKDAGWYKVSASALCQSATQNAIFLSLSTLTAAGDGDIANSGGFTPYSRTSASGNIKLTAGAKVYAYGWSNGASPVNTFLYNFSIERIGGPTGPTGPQGPTGGNATVPIEAWRIVGAAGQPAFLGGWAASNSGAGYQAPSFRKDPLGRVWIRGSFGGSPTVAHAFTLPAGYAPTAIFAFDTLLDNGAAGGYVSVDTLGQVSLQRSSSASIYVDLSFDSGTVTAMPTGPTGPPGPAAVLTPSDPFHIVGAAGEPAYKNGWSALDTRGARFRKYKDGIVRLSGAMNVGTLSTAAFTLPSGSRPSLEGYYPVIANGVHGGVIVGVNGDVIPFAPMAVGYCFVAGIQFDTEGGS
jgi:hypothetical protein